MGEQSNSRSAADCDQNHPTTSASTFANAAENSTPLALEHHACAVVMGLQSYPPNFGDGLKDQPAAWA
jgi:hypothetical protein